MVGYLWQTSNKAKGARATTDERKRLPSFDVNIKRTLFDKLWATVILDEGHEFRGIGRGFYGMLALLQNAGVVIVATATPLHNGPTVRGIETFHFLLISTHLGHN